MQKMSRFTWVGCYCISTCAMSKIVKWICPNCEMNLSKLWNQFVQIVKCICPNCKVYLSKLQIYLSQLQIYKSKLQKCLSTLQFIAASIPMPAASWSPCIKCIRPSYKYNFVQTAKCSFANWCKRCQGQMHIPAALTVPCCTHPSRKSPALLTSAATSLQSQLG